MNVKLTLNIGAGADLGTFDLYSDTDSYVTNFNTSPITRQQLLDGYTTSLVPDGTTIIRITSTGDCTNSYDSTVSLLTVSGKYIIIGSQKHIAVSDDFGVSFTQTELFPAGSSLGSGLGVNTSGKYQLIGFYQGGLFASSDFGVNFTDKSLTKQWRDMSISDEGVYQLAVSSSGSYISSNSGSSFTSNDLPTTCLSCDMNQSGNEMFAIINGNNEGLYKSTNFGVNFSKFYEIDYANKLAISKNDSKYITITKGNSILRSDDFGVSFTTMLVGTFGTFNNVAMSNDGKYQLLVTASGGSGIVVSDDFGATWAAISGTSGKTYNDCFVIDSGETQATITSSSEYYLSEDFGGTFSLETGAGIGSSISINK